MTLAHVAWRFSRTRTTMYHATGPAVPAAARGRVEAHAARHGWPLVLLDAGEQADARYRANPGRSLLLLQDEPVRAHPRGDAGPDRVRHQPRRSRRLPARAARRGRARRRASLRRGGHRQGGRVRARREPRPRRSANGCPAQPCLASRVETGIAIAPDDLAFIDAVETRLAARLGREAVLRCRVTHAGIVIELAAAHDAAAAAIARDDRRRLLPARTGARSPACGPTRAGRRSCARSPMTEFRLDWERAGRTGTSEAVLCDPKSAAQIDAIVAHAIELGGRLLLTRLGSRKFGRLCGARARRARLRRRHAHGDPRRRAGAARHRRGSRSSAAARPICRSRAKRSARSRSRAKRRRSSPTWASPGYGG